MRSLPTRLRGVDFLAGTVLAALTVAMQFASGAYRCDFANDADEAAHAVTSLMIHDYLLHGLPTNPVRFAEEYYIHYPKVAVGHWPPLFHVGEAVWMVLFGRTRTAMLASLALSGAALAIGVFIWLRRESGTFASVLPAVVLCTLPLVQTAVYVIGPDIALACLVFWATAAYGIYLETRRKRHLTLFILLTLAAVGTHGRGMLLIFLPLMTALVQRKCLLGSRSRVAGRILLAVLLIAFVLVVPPLLQQAGRVSAQAAIANFTGYASHMWTAIGCLVLLVAFAGVLAVCADPARHTRDAPMAALLPSGVCFHTLVKTGMIDRYLIAVAPAVVIMAATGLNRICRHPLIASLPAWHRVAAISIPVCFIAAANAFSAMHKPDFGFHRFSETDNKSVVYLVAGDARHEGAFIAEIALREATPKHIVLRASKVLAFSTWSGFGYRTLFDTPASLAVFLDEAHASLIVMQQDVNQPHMLQLAGALAAHPETWRQAPAIRIGDDVQLYKRIGPAPVSPIDIRIDMRKTLGRYIDIHR